MIDKELLRLLGGNKKYIFYTVGIMVLGLIANLSITASICWAIWLLSQGADATAYLAPAVCGAGGIAVRFTAGCISGDMKDLLVRKVKRICGSVRIRRSLPWA